MNPSDSTKPPRTPLAATTGSLMLGGSTTFLLNLVKVFGRRGWKLPIVVLSERVEHREDFAAAQAEVLSIERANHIYEDRLAWGYDQVARFKPEAVLACLSAESFEILRLVPPGVVRLGIIQSDDPGPYRLMPHYAPWLDGMVGVSPEICRRLRAMPETTKLRVECIPYGIDFPPAVPRPARPAGQPLRVVYLGRLIEEQKRISRLVELVRLLEARQANVRFTIVGGGPQEAEVRAALANRPSVELRGTIPNTEVTRLLREQDVYILLSDFEGLPLSLLEAMAEGVVPVVSDLTSGIGEVVTAQTGCRVPIGDVAAAAAMLERLAADSEQWAKLSTGAAALARGHYSAERMANQFLKLIEELRSNTGEVKWSNEVTVPAPRGLSHPWLYRGWPRQMRRWLKRILRAKK